MFKNAEEGDRVWSFVNGWGRVVGIVEDSNFAISVRFNKDGLVESYTAKGHTCTSDINPTLFWDEIKFNIPPKPLPDLEVDTKVIVWDYTNSDRKLNRHFSHFGENRNIRVFVNGHSSWTGEETVDYSHWKLADETNN